MKKLHLYLIIFFLQMGTWGIAQIATIDSLKPWQLKGYAKRYEVMGDYQSAILFYTKYLTYKKNPSIHLKVANLYNKVHDYQNAARIYRIYMSEPDNNGYIAKYHYAEILKNLMNYEEARDILVRYKEKGMNPAKLGINKEILSNSIKGCNYAIQLKDTAVRTVVKPINGDVNRWHTELGATFLDSQNIVFGSTQLDKLLYYSVESSQNEPKTRFYSAHKRDSSWITNGIAKPPFNQFLDANSGSGCFSPDKRRFYFSKGEMNWKYKMVYKLFVTENINGEWSTPKELGGETNKKGFSSTQPTIGNCYDPDLEIIYYVSDRPKGLGGTDIWYTVYNSVTNQFEKTQNAGIYINTAGDELTPFFDYSSHAIYFSSNGWYSLGGLDVFKSFGDLVNWSEPKNIGVPINSSFDDLYFNLIPNSNKGLITSNRNDFSERKNNNYFDDIFEFEESVSEKVWVTGVIYSDDEINDSNIFNTSNNKATIASEEIVSIASNSRPSIIKNQIKPENVLPMKKVLANTSISLRLQQDSLSSVLLVSQKTDSTGRFGFWVEKGNDLKIIVGSDSILNNEISFSTKDTKIEVEKISFNAIPLKVITETPIILKNIYYDFDADKLTTESQTVLDSTLMGLLTKFPHITIEISSHTDNVGTDEYNNSLSLRRANNVKEYLVSKGIDSDRLVCKGYGKSKPIVSNTMSDGTDNPAGRQMNRRTEFIILKQSK